MNHTRAPGHRAALTLVELLVVLLILAIMTTIAVQSVGNLADQARYDATQRTLQNVQDAIIGPPGQKAPDGSLLITGFVADMGRLPQLVNTTSDPLRELWDATAIPPASGYGVQTTLPITNYAPGPGGNLWYPASPPPTGYTNYNNTMASVKVTVTLACGWRGPYIQLPAGTGGLLLDSWGKQFDSMSQGLSPSYSLNDSYGLAPTGVLLVGQQINIVRSFGADNQVDPFPLSAGFSPYNLDQYVPSQSAPPLPPTATTPLTSFSVTGSVMVVVKCLNIVAGPTGSVTTVSDPLPVGPSDAVEIVLFTPVNGVLTPVYGINSSPLPGAANSNYFPMSVTSGTPTPNVTATFTGVPIGPRAVQAFQFDTSTGNVSKRSPLTYLTVPPGGPPALTLILQ